MLSELSGWKNEVLKGIEVLGTLAARDHSTAMENPRQPRRKVSKV